MKIWSLVINDDDNSSFEPEIHFTEAKANDSAEGWVRSAWGDWWDDPYYPNIPWREAYAHLCERTGFIDSISMTEHDISAHPAAAQARGALNNCVDQLNLLADLAKCEDDDVQNARLDVEIALEMLNK